MGLITIFKRDRDPITGAKAQFWTADPDLFQEGSQFLTTDPDFIVDDPQLRFPFWGDISHAEA
jgi:hypothetical protein